MVTHQQLWTEDNCKCRNLQNPGGHAGRLSRDCSDKPSKTRLLNSLAAREEETKLTHTILPGS